MNIDQMQAGREMDALVAESVMGIEKDNTFPRGYPESRLWHYSTAISAAWEVVEKLQQDFFINLICGRNEGRKNGKFGFNCSIGHYENMGKAEWWGDADTAPLAICRAALKALGVSSC